MALLLILVLSLPWAHAVLQRPRAPFLYGAVIGGMVGAVTMALLASNVDFLTTEYALLRSALAALLMGGPLGSLLGQAVAALVTPPRARGTWAALGLLAGPLLGWPPLYLFPARDPHLWHGPYWVMFWLASWAGWGALLGAHLGVRSQSWSRAAKLAIGIVLAALVLPAVGVGARHFDDIRCHVTAISNLEARSDVDGLLWKFDHGEELALTAEALGRAAEPPDTRVTTRLLATLDGIAPQMQGLTRSEREYRQARVAAATALGHLRDKDGLPTLLIYAADPDPVLRGAVVLALTGYRDPQARAAVRQAAREDPDPGIRAAARTALQPLRLLPPGDKG